MLALTSPARCRRREVLAFAADASPKQARKEDRRAVGTAGLCRLVGNATERLDRQQSRDHASAACTCPRRVVSLDPKTHRQQHAVRQIVAGLVSATSRRADQSFEDFCKEMAGYYAAEKTGDFADRETMPHYWARQNFRNARRAVMGFAYSFMGIQIQCAQCHKHPFDQWTKDDFDQFKAFFARVRYGVAPGTKDESDKLLVALGVEPDPKKRKNNNQIQNELAQDGG